MDSYTLKRKTYPLKKEYADGLWRKFIDGDNTCFEIIYNEYVHVLFRYGTQFTKDKDKVKDAIHDIFVKIYHDRTRLNKDVHIKFYLFAALKNSLYNIFKREMIFDKIGEDELAEMFEYAEEVNILSTLDQDNLNKEIKHLLSVLTERQREVIHYRFLEEMSMEEICALMDMNYQSVQNLIQRSLKRLREHHIPFTAALSFLFSYLEVPF